MIGESHGNVLAPDGIYEGTCTGRNIRFARDNQMYQFELVRATDENEIPVKIVIDGLKAKVYKI